MNLTFKTPKGTELPFLNLKGKQYLQVMHRLVWMREEHPDWGIETDFISINDNHAVCVAKIKNNDRIIAIAHGSESIKDFKDFIEKSETKAIGRALAMCGYGTQFAPELDEEDRIVDSPVPRKGDKNDKSTGTNSNRIFNGNSRRNEQQFKKPESVTKHGGIVDANDDFPNQIGNVPENEYTPDWGKFKGKNIYGVSAGALKNYTDWLVGEANKKDKPLTGKVLEFVTIAEKIINTHKELNNE